MKSTQAKRMFDFIHKHYNQLKEMIFKAYDARFKIKSGKIIILLYPTNIVKILHVNDNFVKPEGTGIIASFSARPGEKSDLEYMKYDTSFAEQILEDDLDRLEAEYHYWKKKEDAIYAKRK
ncbi:MAG: hypothetical protein QXV17_01605 [Candidatus Micrarchaeaceae archaeon]